MHKSVTEKFNRSCPPECNCEGVWLVESVNLPNQNVSSAKWKFSDFKTQEILDAWPTATPLRSIQFNSCCVGVSWSLSSINFTFLFDFFKYILGNVLQNAILEGTYFWGCVCWRICFAIVCVYWVHSNLGESVQWISRWRWVRWVGRTCQSVHSVQCTVCILDHQPNLASSY